MHLGLFYKLSIKMLMIQLVSKKDVVDNSKVWHFSEWCYQLIWLVCDRMLKLIQGSQGSQGSTLHISRSYHSMWQLIKTRPDSDVKCCHNNQLLPLQIYAFFQESNTTQPYNCWVGWCESSCGRSETILVLIIVQEMVEMLLFDNWSDLMKIIRQPEPRHI